VLRQLVAENKELEEPLRKLTQLMWRATNTIRSSSKLNKDEKSDLTDLWVEAFSTVAIALKAQLGQRLKANEKALDELKGAVLNAQEETIKKLEGISSTRSEGKALPHAKRWWEDPNRISNLPGACGKPKLHLW
jgi:phage I-like protein